MTEQEWRKEFAFRMRRAFRTNNVDKMIFQKEWAEALGLSENTISRYMRGEYAPDAYTVFRIAKMLDWPIEDLMVDDEYIHED
jgi:DNA-binding XRE family transcriptional regulator